MSLTMDPLLWMLLIGVVLLLVGGGWIAGRADRFDVDAHASVVGRSVWVDRLAVVLAFLGMCGVIVSVLIIFMIGLFTVLLGGLP